MRVLGIIVIILGLVGVVFGIMFLPMASSAENEIADQVAPLTLDQINPKYDAVTATFNKQMATEEPQIQAGKAMPSAIYNYYSAQRALLGLAKANMGTVTLVRYLGIVNICVAWVWQGPASTVPEKLRRLIKQLKIKKINRIKLNTPHRRHNFNLSASVGEALVFKNSNLSRSPV